MFISALALNSPLLIVTPSALYIFAVNVRAISSVHLWAPACLVLWSIILAGMADFIFLAAVLFVASFFAGYHIVVQLNLNVTEPHI